MAQPNPYANYLEPQAAPQEQPPAFIPGGASPTKARDQARADTSLNNTLTNSAHDNAVADAKQRLGNPQDLRKELDALPEVKSYKISVQQLAQALNTKDGPQGDLSLTYAYARAMDPDSVVREGEMGMVANTQSILDRAAEAAKKQFGMDGAGSYTPEARAAIRQEIIRAVDSREKLYSSRRQQFTDLAQRNGIDPFEVVGQHVGETYRDQFRAYDQRRREQGANVGGITANTPDPKGGGVNDPTMRGALPVGTQVQFGMDAPSDQPFDRSKFLMESAGITPDQETQTIAFWNQNGQNPNLTLEAAKQWYQINGINPPIDQALAQMVEQARKGMQFGPIDTTQAEADYKAKLQGGLDKMGFKPDDAHAYADKAARGATLNLADEMAGIGGAIAAASEGRNPVEGYQTQRDMTRLAFQQEDKGTGAVGNALEFAGAIPTAMLIPGGASRSGATVGALAGFGAGNGMSGSAGNALIGGVSGGLIGKGVEMAAPYVSKGISAVANRMPQRNALAPDMAVVEAGQRQGVPVRQADAIPELRNRAAQVETTQNGGPMMQRAAQADKAAVETRINEIGGPGAVSDPFAMGKQVQNAGSRFIDRSRGIKDKLYTRAENLANGQRVDPQQAVKAAAEAIVELEGAGGNANAATINYLRGLGEDLTKNGGFSITEFQALRSAARQQIKGDNALTSSNADRLLQRVMDAFTEDAKAQLPPSAGKALAEADKFYAQRQEFINGTLKQFMGTRGNPLPAETASQRLISMAQGKGNFERFSSMWGKLDDAEKADLSATIASSLGRKGNGDFSLSTLVKSLDPAKGINPRTARMVFGKDGAEALNDLRIIASAKTETAGAMNNSRTGVVTSEAKRGLRSLIFGGLGYSQGGIAGGAVASTAEGIFAKIGEERAARMLLNPDFTKWLRNMPQTTNPKAIDAYFGRLGKIASIAANDNTAFVSAVKSAFTMSPGLPAAQEESNGRRIPPQQ